MAKLLLTMSSEEVHSDIPYALICMTRYGSTWNTMRRKRLWKTEFSDEEKASASRLFSQSRNWTLGKGVPDKVTMSVSTYRLWQKLGAFCASI